MCLLCADKTIHAIETDNQSKTNKNNTKIETKEIVRHFIFQWNGKAAFHFGSFVRRPERTTK